MSKKRAVRSHRSAKAARSGAYQHPGSVKIRRYCRKCGQFHTWVAHISHSGQGVLG